MSTRWLTIAAVMSLYLGCAGPIPVDDGAAQEQAFIIATDDVSTQAPTEDVCEAVCDFYGWDSSSCHSCWESCVSCGPLGGLSEALPADIQDEALVGGPGSEDLRGDEGSVITTCLSCDDAGDCLNFCRATTGTPAFAECIGGCCECELF